MYVFIYKLLLLSNVFVHTKWCVHVRVCVRARVCVISLKQMCRPKQGSVRNCCLFVYSFLNSVFNLSSTRRNCLLLLHGLHCH